MQTEKAKGIIYAVAAYALWGVLPLYWKLIDSVLSIEILAHRIIWAFVFVLALIAFTKQWQELKKIAADKKQLFYTFISSALVTFNWGLYIWAVNSDRIVDASFGYYINPLIVVVLGIVFFKERLDGWKTTALAAASIGVIVLTAQYGRVPWVSLGLAISFGLYGAMKKMVKANSITGLALETAMAAPIALIYIATREFSGQGAFGTESAAVILLLMGAGAVTAIPLLLFAKGARRIPLSALGFTQYISPTISLFIGIVIYNESFSLVRIISFGLIWTGLAIYSISLFRHSKDR